MSYAPPSRFFPSTPAERAYDFYLRASELDAKGGGEDAARLYREALAIGVGLSLRERAIASNRIARLAPLRLAAVTPTPPENDLVPEDGKLQLSFTLKGWPR